jgi:hypothetical protein
VLTELENLSAQGWIKLFYVDESHICSEGYVPYGWQFPEEEVFVGSQKGYRLNVSMSLELKAEYAFLEAV